MKYLFIFAVLFTIVSCETPDSDLVLGKWKYAKMSKNGVLFLSEDRDEAKRIIDKHVAQNIDYMKDVAKFRENAQKEMDQQLNISVELTADSSFIISDNRFGAPMIEKWKYTIDQEKKQLEVSSEGKIITYIYTLKGDELSLTSDGMKVVLSRMKK